MNCSQPRYSTVQQAAILKWDSQAVLLPPIYHCPARSPAPHDQRPTVGNNRNPEDWIEADRYSPLSRHMSTPKPVLAPARASSNGLTILPRRVTRRSRHVRNYLPDHLSSRSPISFRFLCQLLSQLSETPTAGTIPCRQPHTAPKPSKPQSKKPRLNDYEKSSQPCAPRTPTPRRSLRRSCSSPWRKSRCPRPASGGARLRRLAGSGACSARRSLTCSRMGRRRVDGILVGCVQYLALGSDGGCFD